MPQTLSVRAFRGGGGIAVKGNNNVINIGKESHFNSSHIEIWGDNVTLNIGRNCCFNKLYAVFSGSNNKDVKNRITIGNNFTNTENLQLFAGSNMNMDLEIGDDCMFSRNIAIYAHDGHDIYDINTKETINIPKNSLKIGNHVWVGHGVHICKGALISNNTVVGMGSVVAGRFTKENVIIAGNPAKIIKENTNWRK